MTNLHLEIRVVGVMPTDVLEELEGVRVVTETVETVLRSSLADQSALIGIINNASSAGYSASSRCHRSAIGSCRRL